MLRRLLPAGAIALVLAGCGPAKLDVSKTYSVGGDTPVQGFELDAQSKPQTLTIEFSTAGDEVEVVVFKKSDVPTIDDVQLTDVKKALGSKRGKAETFTVDVPDNTATWVAVASRGGEKRDVQLKVTNKK